MQSAHESGVYDRDFDFLNPAKLGKGVDGLRGDLRRDCPGRGGSKDADGCQGFPIGRRSKVDRKGRGLERWHEPAKKQLGGLHFPALAGLQKNVGDVLGFGGPAARA